MERRVSPKSSKRRAEGDRRQRPRPPRRGPRPRTLRRATWDSVPVTAPGGANPAGAWSWHFGLQTVRRPISAALGGWVGFFAVAASS